MLTVSTYDTAGNQCVSALPVTGLRFSSNYPGGFGYCGFELPGRQLGRDWFDLGYFYRVQVRHGLTLVWDGEIRVIEERQAEGPALAVTAFGFGVLAGDETYPRVWADNRYGNWWYIQDDLYAFSVYQPGAFNHDQSARLYLSPKADTFFLNGDCGVLRYSLPADADGNYPAEDIAKVVFDWETVFPVGSWELGCYDRTHTAFLWQRTTTGSGASQTVTPAAGCKQIEFVLRAKATQDSIPSTWENVSDPIVYSGQWYIATNDQINNYQNSGGSLHYSKDAATNYTYPDTVVRAGGVAIIKFHGTAIDYYGMKAPWMGYIKFRLFDSTGALVDDPAAVDCYASPATYKNALYSKSGLTVGDYTLTATVNNTKNGASSDYWVPLDYITLAHTEMVKYKDHEIYGRVTSVVVYATTGTIYADDIAKDVVDKLAVTGIGLSTVKTLVACGSTRSLVPAFFDDRDPTCQEALNWICQFGDHNDKALAWGVWEDKRLWLEVQPQGTVAYRVHPADAEQISVSGSVQEMIEKAYGIYTAEEYEGTASTDAPIWQGTKRTAVQTSAESANRFGSRWRRTGVRVDYTRDKTLVGKHVTRFLADRDLPTMRSSFTLQRPVYNAYGAPIDLSEVRAGSIIEIARLRAREAEALGGTDIRDSNSVFVCVATEYDAEAGTLTVTPDGAKEDLARYLARIQAGMRWE